ncbi:MAG: DNA gyrase inhibitor YacG [Thermodesulfobacteriota bacterium]
MKIKCPECGGYAEWEGNEWRPFCSERCKMLDLGAWVTESYKIPGEPDDESRHGEVGNDEESQ